MARIHRDGQKLPCKIYRFLVQGGLDEKIYQRQIMKMGLANAVVDNKASATSFSQEELRDLFRLDERDTCQTHDILGCSCGGQGKPEAELSDVSDRDVDEEEDDDFAYLGLQKASEVDIDEQEARLQKSKKKGRSGEQPKLKMLMEYAHLDPNVLRAVDENDERALLVDDDVLLEVIRERDSRVGFLLTKRSS
jgi:DNA repair and recombination protein RAD54B